jgi:hypothetical protein
MTEDTESVEAGDMAGMIGADGTMGGEAPPDGGPGGPGGETPPDGGPGGGDMGGGSSGPVVNHLNVENTELTGDIYNGSGYYGETAVGVEVNLGQDAVLNGAIAQTETIHTDAINYTSKVLPEGTSAEEAGQLTAFTIDQYYYIGHVANRYFNNGDNTIAVNLTDNAVWNITGDCLISSLSIADGATVQALDGAVTMTVDGAETELAPGDYEGEIRLSYTQAEPEEPEEEVSAVEEAPEETPEAAVEAEEASAPEASAEEAPAQTGSSVSTGAVVGIVVVILAIIAAVAVALKKKKK